MQFTSINAAVAAEQRRDQVRSASVRRRTRGRRGRGLRILMGVR